MKNPVKIPLNDHVKHNASTIILVASGVGFVVSTGLAIKATTKATLILSEEFGPDDTLPTKTTLLLKEVVPLVWREYIPTAVCLGASMVGLGYAQHLNLRDIAMFYNAYAGLNADIQRYRENVIPAKPVTSVPDTQAPMKTEVDRTTQEIYMLGGSTRHIYFDVLSGRPFTATADEMQRFENELNQMLLSDTWVTINQYYNVLGLEPTKLGDDSGWAAGTPILFTYTARLNDQNAPVIHVDLVNDPREDYMETI